ncbi:MAG TPA: O-antigen ligase family protein [Paraburkholderia sp.]|nr:O-antigen ligase family protein [Paraburkholderia sp.]
MIDRVVSFPDVRRGSSAGARAKYSAVLICLILLVGIGLTPMGDFLSVYALKGQVGGDAGARYSFLVRGAMVTGLVAAMLLDGRVRVSNWRVGALALLVGFMSCVSLANGGMDAKEFTEEIIAIAKVFSLFVYFTAFSELSDRQIEKVEAVMRVTLVIYALAIVAGAAFSIDIFRSYRGETQIRAGYKGVIYAQNEASALLLSGFALICLGVLRRGWDTQSKGIIGLLFTASFLLGTKAAVVSGLGVVAVYSYARYGLLKATVRFTLTLMALLLFALGVYYASPAVHQAVDLSIQYFVYHRDHASEDAIATVIMSGRNVKFVKVWEELSNESFLPLLAGGYPTVRYPVEMDGPDLALIMGIPVILIYLLDLHRLYVLSPNGCIARYGKYFFLLLLMVACSAGHVLTSAIVAPYLAMIAALVHRWSESERLDADRLDHGNDRKDDGV